MDATGEFTQTTTAIARAAGVAPNLVRLYTDLGLLEHVRLSNGVRLLKAGAETEVSRIYAERMAARGNHRRQAAAGA